MEPRNCPPSPGVVSSGSENTCAEKKKSPQRTPAAIPNAFLDIIICSFSVFLGLFGGAKPSAHGWFSAGQRFAGKQLLFRN
jgi:hypothetical protein